MSLKEQRLLLPDVLWILGVLFASGSTFEIGMVVGSGFVHAQGEEATWPTALGWLEVAIAFFGMLAVAAAGWIAARSLVAQREAARRMERATLTSERLRFHSNLMHVSRALIDGAFMEHQQDIRS